MTFHYRYRKQILLGGILLLIIGSISGLFLYKKLVTKEKKQGKEIIVEKKENLIKKEDKKIETKEQYQVDIKGEINVPGIYKVDSETRVMDIITLAGGLTESADTSVINLSKKVTDEMVIIIYSKEEVANFEKTKEIEQVKEEKCIQKEENALKNDACITTIQQDTGKISINTATKEELMTLPGIGEAKAKEIISYREQNGPFQNIEDIKNVTGIGDNLYDSIKEDITL